uniref:Uncharacterized protein n=1 Tax=Rhizophora mucronata TaxID=61149 RepID=A0A2P2L5S4_RHIMU
MLQDVTFFHETHRKRTDLLIHGPRRENTHKARQLKTRINPQDNNIQAKTRNPDKEARIWDKSRQ